MKIHHIEARQILDSRGNPTVEADVWLEGGVFGRAAVPSGASTGIHEAHELRDGGDAYHGQGVEKAVHHIRQEVGKCLKGVRADDQFLVDEKMIQLDGTPNKSRLGANAMLAVSLATAHAAAKMRNVLLYVHINDVAHNPEKNIPIPMMNVLNGGKHANGSSDFQEFMIMPLQLESYADAVQIGSEIFQSLKSELKDRGVSTAVGDEGGFTMPVQKNSEMLDVLQIATKAAGYTPGESVGFALDVAASEFYTEGSYHLACENRTLDSAAMIALLNELRSAYPIVSIEDGLAEDDWDGWVAQYQQMSDLQLVGDDLLVTNVERLRKAVELQAANAILIKPNQIGTLTETISAINEAQAHGWKTIISHRSGETEDVSIAHIAIGTGAGQIKTGSLSRSERTAKHNEIMRLETIDPTLRMASL